MTISPERKANIHALVVGGVVGAIGIFNGFALFFLFEHELKKAHEGHGVTIVAAFCLAAGLAYLIETLRHWIGHPGRSHPSVSEIASTFVVIAISELLLLAVHQWSTNATEFFSAPCKDCVETVIAPLPLDVLFTLKFFAVTWVAIGAICAAWLAYAMLSAPADARHSVLYGARTGANVGFIYAPVATLICVLFLRLINDGYTAAQEPGAWFGYLSLWRHDGEDMDFLTRLFAVTIPVYALELLGIVVGEIGVAATAAVYFIPLTVVIIMKFRKGYAWPFYVVAGIGFLYLYSAENEIERLGAGEFFRALWVALIAGLIWSVTAIILGALVPLLRRFKDDRRWWTAIAFLMAAILMAVTAFRLIQPWWLPMILGLWSLIAGFVFQKGDPFADHWPFMALTVALVIGSITAVSVTFVGVGAQASAINAAVSTGRSPFGADCCYGPTGFVTRREATVCLEDYRERLVWIQFTVLDRKHRLSETINLKEELRKNVEKRRQALTDLGNSKQCDAAPAEPLGEPPPPGCDIASTNVAVMLSENFLAYCRKPEDDFLKEFDKHVAIAKLEAGCVAAGTPQLLEISLAGSFGFWVTLGLLAAYRRYGGLELG